MQSANDVERSRALITRLNSVISSARLGCYFGIIGRLKEAAEQRVIAQREYEECLSDWVAFDMETHADEVLRQTRADAERCLLKAVNAA